MFTPPQALCLLLPLLSTLTAAHPGHRAHPFARREFPKTRTVALQTWVATSTSYETKTKVIAVHDIANTMKIPTHIVRTYHTTKSVELTPSPTGDSGVVTVYQAVQPIERIEVINVVASTPEPTPAPEATPYVNIEKIKIVQNKPQDDDVPVVIQAASPAEKEVPCSTIWETFYSTQTLDPVEVTIDVYTPAVEVVTPAAEVVTPVAQWVKVVGPTPVAAVADGGIYQAAAENNVVTKIAPMDGVVPVVTRPAVDAAFQTVVIEDNRAVSPTPVA